MKWARKRIMLKDLEPMVREYASAFEGWQVKFQDSLVRETIPVLQYIHFERLSGGDIRPNCGIALLCAPKGEAYLLGPQRLQGYDSTFHWSLTVRLKEKVVAKMYEQFEPPLDRPLNLEDIKNRALKSVAPTANEAYSLASYLAYLGYQRDALKWAKRFTKLIEKTGLGWDDACLRRKKYLDDLETWIARGDVTEQLDTIVQRERKSWKLT